MQSKDQILKEFHLFSVPTGGIGSWLTEDTHDDVFARLGKIDEEPLPAVQLNQLLVLAHEAPVSEGFFRYYWLEAPKQHSYDVRHLPGYSEEFSTVRLKVEQYQLLTGLGVFVLQMETRKYLIHRDFFKKGDAENLQDFSETAVYFQFLLEDGHE